MVFTIHIVLACQNQNHGSVNRVHEQERVDGSMGYLFARGGSSNHLLPLLLPFIVWCFFFLSIPLVHCSLSPWWQHCSALTLVYRGWTNKTRARMQLQKKKKKGLCIREMERERERCLQKEHECDQKILFIHYTHTYSVCE